MLPKARVLRVGCVRKRGPGPHHIRYLTPSCYFTVVVHSFKRRASNAANHLSKPENADATSSIQTQTIQGPPIFRLAHMTHATPSPCPLPETKDRPEVSRALSKAIVAGHTALPWHGGREPRQSTARRAATKTYVSRGTFPILSRDPSFYTTSGNPGKTAGFWKEPWLKRMRNQPLECMDSCFYQHGYKGFFIGLTSGTKSECFQKPSPGEGAALLCYNP